MVLGTLSQRRLAFAVMTYKAHAHTTPKSLRTPSPLEPPTQNRINLKPETKCPLTLTPNPKPRGRLVLPGTLWANRSWSLKHSSVWDLGSELAQGCVGFGESRTPHYGTLSYYTVISRNLSGGSTRSSVSAAQTCNHPKHYALKPKP